jgi:hypothetical protein
MALLARILVIAALFGAASSAFAQDLTLAEQKIKAGMLYNFLKYTDWPADAVSSSSITVCLLGGDPFAGNLAPLEGRSVNRRTITLRTVSDEGLGGCQLLVIGSSVRPRWSTLRTSLQGKPILTVSDSGGFAAEGGMIEFTRSGSRITVDLNLDAVRAAHLQIQQRLVNLVTIVSGRS